MSLYGPFPSPHRRAEQPCPLPNGTAQLMSKVTSDSEMAQDKELRSTVASPLPFQQEVFSRVLRFSPLHQLR